MNILKKIFGEKNVDSCNYEELAYKYKNEAKRWQFEAEILRREVRNLEKEVSALKALDMKNKHQADTSVKSNYPVNAEKRIEIEFQNKTSEGNKAPQIKKDSGFLIPQEKKVKVENKDVEANLEKLQSEAASMQALYDKIGEEMADLRKGIDRMKISLSTCQKQYKDNYQIPQAPKVSVPKDSEEDKENAETTAPPTIIPKPLTIKGYEDFYNVIYRNLSSLSFSRVQEKDKERHMVYTPRSFNSKTDIAHLGYLLKDCGKEILLIKCDQIEEEEFEDNEKVINTCKRICELKESGDKPGLEKYLTYFLTKYPQPRNPFDNENPVDFIQDEYVSVYNTGFYLMYFLNRYYNAFDKSNVYKLVRSWHAMLQKVEINEALITLMNILNDLLYFGYRMCIVPINDKNILYRPKSAAQDGDVFSLLYYDKYIEIPEMESSEKKEENLYSAYGTTAESSYGTSYVNGHYRSGYMRNGRWVSGGYVKGHYRS